MSSGFWRIVRAVGGTWVKSAARTTAQTTPPSVPQLPTLAIALPSIADAPRLAIGAPSFADS